MKVRLAVSQQSKVSSALGDICAQLGALSPSILFVGFHPDLSGEDISVGLARKYPCPIIGASSCRGVLGLNVNRVESQASLVVMAILDEGDCYGVGHCLVGEEPSLAAREALDMALYASGRGYESPALIWCMLPPGQEEAILRGFVDVVGPNVPVLGGSSADNDVVGDWQQITDLYASGQQVAVAVLYPSSPLSMFFSSGYKPTGITARVTSATGRDILTLNDQPAAKLFNQITEGLIGGDTGPRDVLAISTLSPFGRKMNSPVSVDEFVLSHPCQVTSSDGLSLFSEVQVGEELHLMSTTLDNLVTRAERVIYSAINLLPENRQPAGVLLIYCAGCMLAIEDRVHEVAESLAVRFPGLPVLGWYTYGEQGCFLDGISRHGNLMISAVAFSQ